MIRGGRETFVLMLIALFVAGCSGGGEQADQYSTDQLIFSEGKYYALGEVEPYTGLVINRYPNGKKKYEARMVDGIPQGPAMEWHENGQKMTEVKLEEGKPAGTMTGWHSNGAKQFEMPLQNGKQHGLMTEYDIGNRRTSSTRYVVGVREGEAIGYDVNGKKSWETHYRNNLMDGDFIEYHPNGQRSSRSPYKNGKLRGVAEGWYANGAKSWMAGWEGTKPMGAHQNWHPNGKIQRKQVFVNGTLTHYTEWHANGQMTLEARYRGSTLVSQKRWDANGTVLLDESGTAESVPGLPPARKPDPPKPNPNFAGRRTVWVTGQLNRVYRDKDAVVVQTAFGEPDEKRGDVWIYKNITIINSATRRRLASAQFYISKGKVILVEEK